MFKFSKKTKKNLKLYKIKFIEIWWGIQLYKKKKKDIFEKKARDFIRIEIGEVIENFLYSIVLICRLLKKILLKISIPVNSYLVVMGFIFKQYCKKKFFFFINNYKRIYNNFSKNPTNFTKKLIVVLFNSFISNLLIFLSTKPIKSIFKKTNLFLKKFIFFLFFYILPIKRKTWTIFWRIYLFFSEKKPTTVHYLEEFMLYIKNEIFFKISALNSIIYAKLHYMIYILLYLGAEDMYGYRCKRMYHGYLNDNLVVERTEIDCRMRGFTTNTKLKKNRMSNNPNDLELLILSLKFLWTT